MKKTKLFYLGILATYAIFTNDVSAHGIIAPHEDDEPWTFQKIFSTPLADLALTKPQTVIDLLSNIEKYRNMVNDRQKACSGNLKGADRKAKCAAMNQLLADNAADVDHYYPDESKGTKRWEKVKNWTGFWRDRITVIVSQLKKNPPAYRALKVAMQDTLEQDVCDVTTGKKDINVIASKMNFLRASGVLMAPELDSLLKDQTHSDTRNQALRQMYFCDDREKDAQAAAAHHCHPHSEPPVVSSLVQEVGQQVGQIDSQLQKKSPHAKVTAQEMVCKLGQKNLENTCFANSSHVYLDDLTDIYPDLLALPPKPSFPPLDHAPSAEQIKLRDLKRTQYQANKSAVRLMRRFKLNAQDLSDPSVGKSAEDEVDYREPELADLFDSHEDVLKVQNGGNDPYFTNDDRNWRGKEVRTYLRKNQQDPVEYLNRTILENMNFADRHGFRTVNARQKPGSAWSATNATPAENFLTVPYNESQKNQHLQDCIDSMLLSDSAPVTNPNGTRRSILASSDPKMQSLTINLGRTDHRRVEVPQTLRVKAMEAAKLPKDGNGNIIEGAAIDPSHIKDEVLNLQTVVVNRATFFWTPKYAHYYSYSYDPDTTRWIRRDDNKRVSIVSTAEAMADIEKNGKIFLYRKMNRPNLTSLVEPAKGWEALKQNLDRKKFNDDQITTKWQSLKNRLQRQKLARQKLAEDKLAASQLKADEEEEQKSEAADSAQ